MASGYIRDWAGKILAGGRYRVDVRLGSEKSGAVYRAFDLNLDSEVIIRVPRLEGSAEQHKRFVSQIRSLIKLSHPHIVKALDVGEHEGVPFAVMQFLSGGSLVDRRRAGIDGSFHPMPQESVATWLPGIAAALDFIHQRGFIHGDVKPSNILFDEQGNAFLSNFLPSRALPADASLEDAITASELAFALGTPHYIAPELIASRPFDGGVDQYALGVTIYELLSGAPPFDASSPSALLKHHRETNPSPLWKRNFDVSPALASAVARALAKEPQLRYPGCTALSQDVAAALAPIMATKSQPRPQQATAADAEKLACPKCAAKVRISEALRNQKASCPTCGVRVHVSEDLTRLTLVHESGEYGVRPGIKGAAAAASGPATRARADFLDEVLQAQAKAAPLPPPPTGIRGKRRWASVAAAGAGLIAVLAGLVFVPGWIAPPRPEIEPVANQLVRRNDVLDLQIKVTNPNDFPGKLRYVAADGAPKGFTVDSETGRCSWLAKDVAEGDYDVSIEVAPVVRPDMTTTVAFKVRVYREHNAPRVMVAGMAPTRPVEGDTVRVYLNGDDVDGDDLTFEYRLQHPRFEHDWMVAKSDDVEFPANFPGDYVLQVRARDDSGPSPVVTHVVAVLSKQAADATSTTTAILSPSGPSAMNDGRPVTQSGTKPGAPPTLLTDDPGEPRGKWRMYRDKSWEQWVHQFMMNAYSSYYSRTELDLEREAIVAIVEMCRLHPECMEMLIDTVASYRSGLAENTALRLLDVEKIFTPDAMPKPSTSGLPAAGYENAVLAIYENRMPVEQFFRRRIGFAEVDRKDWIFMSLVELVGEPGLQALVRATDLEAMRIPCCAALGKLGAPAIPELTKMLSSKEPGLAFHALWGLGLALRSPAPTAYLPYHDVTHKSVRDEVQKLLYHEDPQLSTAASLLLAAWAKPDAAHLPRIVDLLTKQMSENNDFRQERAAMLLVKLPESTPHYIAALTKAAEAGKIPSPVVLSKLMLFGEQGNQIHARLVRTGKIGNSREYDVAALRQSAISAVAFVDEGLGPTRELIQAVGEAALEHDDKIRNRALQSLRDLGIEARPVTETMMTLSKDATVSELHQRIVAGVLENIRLGKRPKVGVPRIAP